MTNCNLIRVVGRCFLMRVIMEILGFLLLSRLPIPDTHQGLLMHSQTIILVREVSMVLVLSLKHFACVMLLQPLFYFSFFSRSLRIHYSLDFELNIDLISFKKLFEKTSW